MGLIQGIHHITGAVTNPQRDYDFYTRTLGMRMVKQTVNHESPNMWHFFYGNHSGDAGTIMTNIIFPENRLPRCTKGRGRIDALSYSVPAGSLGFWKERLERGGYTCEQLPDRFGEKVLYFEDPEGLPSELIECDDQREAIVSDDIPVNCSLRGFHGLTLASRLPELTLEFFTTLMGCEVVDQNGNRTRLALNGGEPGRWIDLLDEPEGPWAKFGLGAIHHAAFTVPDLVAMKKLWHIFSGSGLILTDMRDRKWFHSTYFTEPGGINIEFSNVDPGFIVDEDVDHLGETLQLPKQWQDQYDEIAGGLPDMKF